MSNVLQPTLDSSFDSKLLKFHLYVIVKLYNINEIMLYVESCSRESLSPFTFKSMDRKKAVIICPIFLLLFDFMITVLFLKLKKITKTTILVVGISKKLSNTLREKVLTAFCVSIPKTLDLQRRQTAINHHLDSFSTF